MAQSLNALLGRASSCSFPCTSALPYWMLSHDRGAACQGTAEAAYCRAGVRRLPTCRLSKEKAPAEDGAKVLMTTTGGVGSPSQAPFKPAALAPSAR